jgi:hypothetical protein
MVQLGGNRLRPGKRQVPHLFWTDAAFHTPTSGTHLWLPKKQAGGMYRTKLIDVGLFLFPPYSYSQPLPTACVLQPIRPGRWGRLPRAWVHHDRQTAGIPWLRAASLSKLGIPRQRTSTHSCLTIISPQFYTPEPQLYRSTQRKLPATDQACTACAGQISCRL